MMKRLLLAGNIAIVLLACQKNEPVELPQHAESLIIGKATPILLQNDKTNVLITDYVLTPHRVDSITNDGSLTQNINGDTLELSGKLTVPLSTLHFWSEGISESVLLKKSNKTTYNFTYKGEGSDMKIKGEFNAWNPNNTLVKKTSDGFEAQVILNPGQYQYLFVVDGNEMRDPNNPDSTQNGMGGWNSIIKIPRANPEKLPIISTSSFKSNKIHLSTSNKPKKVLAFLDNYALPKKAIEIKDSQITLTLPKNIASNKSQIRLWAYNKEGVSNDVLIPLVSGKILTEAKDITREDKESMIMYFLMVDRFKNGNLGNDKPLNIPEVHPKADYYGGDLAGVQQKIDDGYFKSLGINTIWLSPISQNPEGAFGKYPTPKTAFSGYHGYWPIRSKVIDYRFGNSKEMHQLVKNAHNADFNVLLDYVANHVHELHPVYQNNKNWATDLYLPDGSMNTERWDDHRLTTWFDTFLPTLDLSRMEIIEPMTDSAIFWLKEYDIDGFRHDATKHIPLNFWRTLTNKVKKQVIKPENKMIFQIGETYGSRELINSYINTGMLEGQFDFNLYDDAVAAFAQDDAPFSRLVNSLKESLAYYGDHNLMGYITGNQDRARFISYADGSIKFDEDAKLAGWTREISVQDTTAYHKLSSLTAFMMTIPGIPVVYYGDEIGSPGGNDPDNRRMMRFDSLTSHEKATLDRAKTLINLRSSNLALIYGDLNILFESDDLLVIKRSYFDINVIAAFNKSSVEKTFTLEKNNNYKTHFNSKINNTELKLAPYSFEIITY